MLLAATRLTIFTGSMFSGKTDRLIMAIRQHTFARQRIKIAKAAEDGRTVDCIASRQLENGLPQVRESFPAMPIRHAEDFLAFTAGNDYDVLAIDEVQFFPLDDPMQDCLGWFGREIRTLLHRRKNNPLHIYLAGLDTMSDDAPFGPMPGLLALADSVEKLKAVCMACTNAEATKSQIIVAGSAGLRVGDIETYEARCRRCFTPA